MTIVESRTGLERAAAPIAPKRFHPEHAAWLPVLHTHRGPWHFTALHSNAALAPKPGRGREAECPTHDND